MRGRLHDYVPRADAEFNLFFQKLTLYVLQKTAGASPDWRHIPAAEVTALNVAWEAWREAYAKIFVSPTRVDITAKNEARAGAEGILRPFVKRFLHWPPVTDEDRISMGVPNRDLVITPHFDVQEVVEFELKLRNIREVLVNFWIKGQTHRAKPEGYDGAVIVWDMLDAPPANPAALTQHTMASRTPHALMFGETERGMTVYIAAAWQNRRGITGHWSEIQSAVIP
jgi:hypothetical protein